jgi:hypothetical protein
MSKNMESLRPLILKAPSLSEREPQAVGKSRGFRGASNLFFNREIFKFIQSGCGVARLLAPWIAQTRKLLHSRQVVIMALHHPLYGAGAD